MYVLKMCTVDIQYVNVFGNRFYRKEVKDKYKIVIKKWERHSVVAYPHPFYIQCNLVNICTYKSNICVNYVAFI